MSSFWWRFFTFVKKEKTRDFFAFTFFVLFLFLALGIDMPFALDIVCFVIVLSITALGCSVYLSDWMDEFYVKNLEKLGKNIRQELKKITKELAMYIPFWLISWYITDYIVVGQPANQTGLEESFKVAPISNSILAIVIAPMLEEFIFRFLPYRFIKNKTLYVIISSIIFAGLHVIDDPNPFYYIWVYLPDSFYYTYRYSKTKNIWVTISLHSFNNLIATLLFFLN